MKTNIVLGNKVKDVVTGFTGVAISKVEYLNGCIRYCVMPMVGKDGKMPDGEYVDEGQLVIVDTEILPSKDKKEPTGGPAHDKALARSESKI